MIATLLIAGLGVSGELPLRLTRLLPYQVEIAVPEDWRISNETELRRYELRRDNALEHDGLTSEVGSVVPFQATKKARGASAAAMLTFLPAEASQEEVAHWAQSDVESLGRRLGEAQGRGLMASGARDVVCYPATRTTVGGRLALQLTITFIGSDAQPYAADKYFIYTPAHTIVLTLQWTTGRLGLGRKDLDRILASFRSW